MIKQQKETRAFNICMVLFLLVCLFVFVPNISYIRAQEEIAKTMNELYSTQGYYPGFQEKVLSEIDRIVEQELYFVWYFTPPIRFAFDTKTGTMFESDDEEFNPIFTNHPAGSCGFQYNDKWITIEMEPMYTSPEIEAQGRTHARFTIEVIPKSEILEQFI